MQARMHVEQDGETLAVIQLSDTPTVIGRGEQCHVRLEDARVSGSHLEVTRHGSAFVATDLGSTNGTLINGRRLERPTRLSDGDTLLLGATRLRVTIPTVVGATGTEVAAAAAIALTADELKVAAALVSPYRVPGALAARPATRQEIADRTSLAERTVTRRLESLATKLRIGEHDPRERSQLLAQRILVLGLDRQRD